MKGIGLQNSFSMNWGPQPPHHSPLQNVSADVRFPDLGTESKNAERMSGSVVGLISSRESGEPNDKTQILVAIATYGQDSNNK